MNTIIRLKRAQSGQAASFNFIADKLETEMPAPPPGSATKLEWDDGTVLVLCPLAAQGGGYSGEFSVGYTPANDQPFESAVIGQGQNATLFLPDLDWTQTDGVPPVLPEGSGGDPVRPVIGVKKSGSDLHVAGKAAVTAAVVVTSSTLLAAGIGAGIGSAFKKVPLGVAIGACSGSLIGVGVVWWRVSTMVKAHEAATTASVS